jgi:hypothetical protein
VTRSIRATAATGLTVVAALAIPTFAAGAVTLGSSHLDQAETDFGAGCGSPSCTWMQKRLPGAQVRAPFSGDIRKWRVVSPGVHDYQLVVMHKKRNGKFKNVGQSSIGSTNGAGTYEFPSRTLSINKGDYIGIMGDSVQGIDNPQAKGLAFDPGVEFPDARKPSFSSASEYQFNATVRRH